MHKYCYMQSTKTTKMSCRNVCAIYILTEVIYLHAYFYSFCIKRSSMMSIFTKDHFQPPYW